MAFGSCAGVSGGGRSDGVFAAGCGGRVVRHGERWESEYRVDDLGRPGGCWGAEPDGGLDVRCGVDPAGRDGVGRDAAHVFRELLSGVVSGQ